MIDFLLFLKEVLLKFNINGSTNMCMVMLSVHMENRFIQVIGELRGERLMTGVKSLVPLDTLILYTERQLFDAFTKRWNFYQINCLIRDRLYVLFLDDIEGC